MFEHPLPGDDARTGRLRHECLGLVGL
jgi:hypothetical protein